MATFFRKWLRSFPRSSPSTDQKSCIRTAETTRKPATATPLTSGKASTTMPTPPRTRTAPEARTDSVGAGSPSWAA
jgi:hypothetical protein